MIFIIYCLLFSLTGYTANQISAVKVDTLTDIQQRIQSIKEKQSLSEEIKNRIIAAYSESIDNLTEAQAQENQAEAYKQSMNNLPLEDKIINRQIADAENDLKNRKQEKLANFPTDELEQRLIFEKTDLSDLDAEISKLEVLLGDQLNRPQLIREKIAEIKNKQTVNQQAQQQLIRSIDSLVEKEAKLLRIDTRIRLLNITLKALELENISAPLRLQVYKNKLRLLSLQREMQNMQIADLDNFLFDRRQQEIDKESTELLQAEKAAEGKHPLILATTKENMQYNRVLQDLNKNMEQYLLQKNDLESRYKQIEKDFQSAEQKIDLAGLSPALGNLLREQRRNLPQHKQYNDLNDNLQNEIAKTSLESFKLDDVRKNLTDVGQVLMSRMAEQVSPDMSDADKLKLRTELRVLLNDQKDLVTRLVNVYMEYTRVLGDVDFNLQQMLASADKFSAYLDQRLLWIPSAPVIDRYYIKDLAKSVFWFISPSHWFEVIQSSEQGIENYAFVFFLGFAFIAFHAYFKKTIKARLQDLLAKPAQILHQQHSFFQTLISLVYLFILSLSETLIMFWLAATVILSGKPSIFSHSFAVGLYKAGISLAVLQFFLRFFKENGIAAKLFQWQPYILQLLYSQFKWARFILVPCLFITAMTGSEAYSEQSLALGRAALIVMMVCMAYLFHKFSHPLIGLGKEYYRNAHGWFKSGRYLWYGLIISIPLIIIGFAVAGYYQSALQLQEKLIYTFRLVFITVLFHEVAQRWLVATQRQLALRNANEKRKQSENPNDLSEGIYPPIANLVDISRINQQSHILLNTLIGMIVLIGSWIIWREILPAFSVLERIELWERLQLVDGKEVVKPITLINLIFTLCYACFTYVLVSNFPALVDLFSVGKYQLSAGSRYALVQLVRYSLVTFAFLASANELGGSWSQVQWLVAALSVGLGFGLQEIFANMVSGIILLFERPIRVGDTVTVGEVTGRVTRIQMRATHIVDYDRKELVVPNKIFITDRLINWTLSDTVTRLVLRVGVAYGSDITEVVTVITEAIKNTPMVLLEPTPSVLFTGFGDSSLDFDIHVFVHELTKRLELRHVLHKNIYEALSAHKIKIPFPQRDVNIRSMTNVEQPKI